MTKLFLIGALACCASPAIATPMKTCADGSIIRRSATCPAPAPAPAPVPAPAPDPTPVGVPAGYTVKVSTAKCDGVTDDTAALQANLSGLASYQALQLPAGTCVTSNILRIGPGKTNVMVFGAGMDATIIKATVSAYSAVVGTQDAGLILHGFQVTSPSAATRISNCNACGVYVEKSSGVLVDGVKVNHVAGAGVYLSGVNGGTVQNSVVAGNLADGFHVTGASQNITLQANTADRVGDDAFASIGYTLAAQNRSISIIDNVATDGAWGGGIGIEGTVGATIARNKVYRSGIACVRVDSQASYSTPPSDQIAIDNNYCEGNVTRTTTGHGAFMFYVNWSGGYVRITGSGNTIVSPASGKGVRAYGYAPGNDVQATLTGTTMTGVATSYSVGSYATVTR